MKNILNRQRPPRSQRKYVRSLKARLRRELGPEAAIAAIERELSAYRRRRTDHSRPLS